MLLNLHIVLIASTFNNFVSLGCLSHNGAPTKAARGIMKSLFFKFFLINVLSKTLPCINLKFLKKYKCNKDDLEKTSLSIIVTS